MPTGATIGGSPLFQASARAAVLEPAAWRKTTAASMLDCRVLPGAYQAGRNDRFRSALMDILQRPYWTREPQRLGNAVRAAVSMRLPRTLARVSAG